MAGGGGVGQSLNVDSVRVPEAVRRAGHFGHCGSVSYLRSADASRAEARCGRGGTERQHVLMPRGGGGAGDGLAPAAVRVRPPLSRTGRSLTAASSRLPPRTDPLQGAQTSGLRFAEPTGRPQRSGSALGRTGFSTEEACRDTQLRRGDRAGQAPALSMQRHASGLRFAEPVLSGARAAAWDPGAELPSWSRLIPPLPEKGIQTPMARGRSTNHYDDTVDSDQ